MRGRVEEHGGQLRFRRTQKATVERRARNEALALLVQEDRHLITERPPPLKRMKTWTVVLERNRTTIEKI